MSEHDEEKLSTAFEDRIEDLEHIAEQLQSALEDALNGFEHIDRISIRRKDTDSFVDKALNRKVDPPYEAPLAEIEDQVAGRVIVFFKSDLDVIGAKLREEFNPAEHQRKEPGVTEFDYESDHYVFVIPPHVLPEGWEDRDDTPQTFEVQVRTLFQHAWAEPQHDLGYKGKDVPREVRRELAWVAASAWGADRALERVRAKLSDN